ncbi:hypothetical protein SAMN05428959_107196 [Duganella sp. CF517]|uniref:hypothetical protein n=1 Tax=Duganella sp. CF517 TaxID=1881038 RepID=UPI0008BDBEEC|nr:hypothetical protein [Duganella sp. CF517]SEO39803.1 hypothetical protein SAMN05428959_107196 [Duganella sp. CF517]
MTKRPDENGILDDAWEQIVGGMDWLKSVFFGEFVDNRPLSAVMADMLVSFLPGVVIVTSARDAVAVILRLANHPEKREDLMEWVLLCACLIVIALPLAMAAGGFGAAGVGAIVGGIAGSELGAALRAVMLLLIKEASELVELVRFLQKFIKGDILKFLRAVKFAQYEKALLQALRKISGKLLEIVKSLRVHLESLKYFDSVKAAIAKLVEWEKKFYAVQQDGLKQIPKALVELDARLGKVLAQAAPKEAHTVSAGVQADKTVAAVPAKQRVRDTPGKVLAKVEDEAPAAGATLKPTTKPAPKPKGTPKPVPDPPLKDSPHPGKPPDDGANTKKQAAADATAAADLERVTQLSNEAKEAEKSGDTALAAAKIKEARDILEPHLPKNPGDNWDEVIKRLDVSSPKDGAVFWSGTSYQAKLTGHPDAARTFAEKIGGVTLETTPGGRIIDNWPEVNSKFAWNADKGPPPWTSDLWENVSKKYAEAVTGQVNLVQTPAKLWDPTTIWHTQEKPTLTYLQKMGQISEIKVHVVDGSSTTNVLSQGYIEQLLKFDQRPKP